jgi:uncharacterized protein (PEP-CTERM system associated)
MPRRRRSYAGLLAVAALALPAAAGAQDASTTTPRGPQDAGAASAPMSGSTFGTTAPGADAASAYESGGTDAAAMGVSQPAPALTTAPSGPLGPEIARPAATMVPGVAGNPFGPTTVAPTAVAPTAIAPAAVPGAPALANPTAPREQNPRVGLGTSYSVSLMQRGAPQPGGGGASYLGGTTQLGNLRDQIATALQLTPPTTAEKPDFVITPGIAVGQALSANTQSAGVLPRNYWLTTVTPSLQVSADSAHVQGNILFAPTAQLYDGYASQNQILSNMSGAAHVTLWPEHLFVDLVAFSSMQAVTPGSGPSNATVLTKNNAAETYNFAVAPYYRQTFGDYGTGELGGSFTANALRGNNAVYSVPGLPPQIVGNQTNNNAEAHAAFVSGEALGRMLIDTFVSGRESWGTGVYNGAYRNVASFETGYAITRRITLLGTIGYDDIYYASAPEVRISNGLWNVGFQITPNPDSLITVRYGRKDGITGPFLQATYAPTPRTRVFGLYNQQVSTYQELLQGSLATATVDAFGNPINGITGAPLLAFNNFFGVQSGVLKFENASVGAALLLGRDTIAISYNQARQAPLGAVPGTVVYAANGAYGSLQWQHDLSEDLSATLSGQYGIIGQSVGEASQTSRLTSGTAALTYRFSETLSGTFAINGTRTGYDAPFGYQSNTLVGLSLSKTF